MIEAVDFHFNEILEQFTSGKKPSGKGMI